METRTGYLTVYSADRSEIYGEFADATWEVEETEGGSNHLFTGKASEGTMETFRRLDREGIDHIAYDFDAAGKTFSGSAQLLRPQDNLAPGDAWIRIESGVEPATA
ncbi:MAG TPA: hypothetical protein VHE55_01920 [Fimbriimonadaceae bacterium]|nr:hypothetical protein [Fimbriimonadaceae bacterium]